MSVTDSRSSQRIKELPNPDVSKADDEYFMRHTKRGLALVFNHYKFDTRDYGNDEQCKPPKREGTNVDRDSLLTAFSNLGFEVESLDDKCYKEIKRKLDEVADQDHSDRDCLAVVVLTHGESGGWLDARDREYDPRELWKPFTATNCRTLAGKPKLFFIQDDVIIRKDNTGILRIGAWNVRSLNQACRGRTRDHGLFLRNAVGDATDAAPIIPSGYQVPSFADFLISFSTFEGHVAFRYTTTGSWYVQTLCNQLDQHAGSKDLVSLLTDVNRVVGREFRSVDPLQPSKKFLVQGPCFTSSLTRRLHLRPPVAPATEDPPHSE